MYIVNTMLIKHPVEKCIEFMIVGDLMIVIQEVQQHLWAPSLEPHRQQHMWDFTYTYINTQFGKQEMLKLSIDNNKGKSRID